MERSSETVAALPPEIRGAHEVIDRAAIEARAWQLIEEGPEVLEGEWERHDNARTALFEGLTASGHLSVVEITGRTVEEINERQLALMVNGYKSCPPGHERTRRFAELCNGLVIGMLHTEMVDGEMPLDTAVVEKSDYPSVLSDEEARRNGYRSYNRKGMIRSTYLRRNDDDTYTRVIEQLSRSNSTDEGTFTLFEQADVTPYGHGSPDVVVLNTPLLYTGSGYTDAALHIQRQLDANSGPDILYGERVGTQPLHVAYEQVREESKRREAQLDMYVDKLEAFDRKLERAWQAGHISAEQRDNQYKAELLTMLRSICLVCPEYAEDCFGEEAAALYHEASDYAAMGDYASVDMIMGVAQLYEQPVVLCGTTLTPEEAALLGLMPDSLQELTESAKESWTVTKGVCRIKNCPSPKPTDIGPCHVCMESCQLLFDQGVKDPSKIYAVDERRYEMHELVEDMLAPLQAAGKLALAGV